MEKINEYVIGNKVFKSDNLSQGEAENVSKAMENNPIDCEKEGLEKNAEEILIITEFNNLLKEEFEEISLPFMEIPAERIIFLSKEPYEKLTGGEAKGDAFFRTGDNFIAANRDAENNSDRLLWYKKLLHEMTHYRSFEKTAVRKKKRDDEILDVKTKNLRLGYLVSEHYGGGEEKFRGFNEGVTDRIVFNIFEKHSEKLAEEFGVSKDDGKKFMSNWDNFYEYSFFVRDMVIRIAEKTGENRDDVWKEMERGYFSGEMMHLRKIEKVFGKGALEILAKLGSDSDANRNVYNFFKLDRE